MTTLLGKPMIWITEQSLVRRLLTQNRVLRRIADRFVAGETLEEGMAAARSLQRAGVAGMLDHLGENVASPGQAAAAADAYIRALKCVGDDPEVDCNISVKLTQLGLDAGIDVCLENVERVLQVASERDPPTLVMIDMEAREYVDGTLAVYLKLRDRYQNVGVCLQAYLHRTADDAHRIGGPQAIVRMAKGAYLEPPDVAFSDRTEVRKNYARVAAALLAAGSTVHLATHDPRLIEGAKGFIGLRGVAEDRYEFQMLYGVRRDLQQTLVREGLPVRVYIPYGSSWYPYLTRRLAERPANVWFFASNLLRPTG